MKKLILAVDPGAGGGFAWLRRGGLTEHRPMPKRYGEIIDLIKNLPAATGLAYVEQIVKHMGEGIPASTMVPYAATWGFTIGALRMAGWTVELVTPQAWQKALGLGITGRQRANVKGMTPNDARAEKVRIRELNAQLKRDWKAKLKSEAERLNPHLKVTFKTADALLILEYGIREQTGRLGL